MQSPGQRKSAKKVFPMFDFNNLITSMRGMYQRLAGSPALAPDNAASSASPEEDQRRIQWAPDNSTYVDLNQYPNALWQDASYGGGSEGGGGFSPAGFYTPGGYDSSGTEGSYYQPKLITPFSAGRDFSGEASSNALPSYQQLRSDGMWDLSTPDSPTWGYLQSKAGAHGDVKDDAGALLWGLLNSGAAEDFWHGDMGTGTIEGAQANRPSFEQHIRDALSDLPPELLDQLVPAYGEAIQNYQSNIDDSTTLRDVADTFREMVFTTPLGAALGAFAGPLLAGSAATGSAAAVPGMFGTAGSLPGVIGAGATIGGVNAFGAGGDILKGAAQGGLSAYGGSQIPGAAADAADYDWIGDPSSGSTLATRGVADPNLAGVSAAPSYTGMLSGFGQMSDSELNTLDAKNRDTLEAGDNPAPAAEPKGPSIDPRTAAKVANALIGMTGNDPQAQGAPQRQEGQSDADYSHDLAGYLGLDADTMAQQGLTPGTQDYYDYIMQQADQVIQQIAGDVDVNGDDLVAQFRGKSQEELEQLQRALYVRGQMDVLTGSGQHTDPFTGESQNVVAPGAGMFNPNVGAFQRGKAGDVEALRGMPGQEGYDYLQQLLGRNVDLFGMDRAASARFERAKLEDDDTRRRRGMLSR